MRGWWRDLTDLVLPAECGGCGRARTVLCPRCRAALSGAAPRRVRPEPEPPGLPPVHAAARYADEVRAVLLAHKERGALALAGPLGTALAGAVRAGLGAAGLRAAPTGAYGVLETGVAGAVEAGARRAAEAGALGAVGAGAHGAVDTDGRGAVEAGALGVVETCGPGGLGFPGGGAGGAVGRGGAGWRADRVAGAGGSGVRGERAVLLVPVPSARRAVRARGHDPARRIALAAAGELRRSGTPARMLAALRHRRAVADQSGLDSRQRWDNLAGALAVVPGAARLLRGAAAVVLVDDVMTTGASLAEAARAVRASADGGTDPAGRTAPPAGRTAGPGGHMTGMAAVYSWAMGEGRGERMGTAPEERTDRAPAGPERAGADGGTIRRVMCAAVVAASPESFEINRN
ncbi:ComF family protein [Streptomyces leeuwenhoekii]|uniref:ComF family protein n=1 Tax=Streptomyces leeuwenhoekii TaxID=1437453 RepID=UPI0036AFECE1